MHSAYLTGIAGLCMDGTLQAFVPVDYQASLDVTFQINTPIL